MNTAQQLPILANVDRVILGSSHPAVAEALSLAEAGYKVALVTSRSFLGTEELTLHAPLDTLPDHRKKQLEESCRSAGITLLYGVWVVDRTPREKEKILVRLAGKFGLAGILTRRVEDFREELGDITFRAWLTNRDAPEQIRILETENPWEHRSGVEYMQEIGLCQQKRVFEKGGNCRYRVFHFWCKIRKSIGISRL